MSTTELNSTAETQVPETRSIDMKLEVVILPVSDADRSKQFYASLGWREDADFPISEGFRVLQFTPPGSQASIIFGTGVTPAAPGDRRPGTYTGATGGRSRDRVFTHQPRRSR